MRKLNIKMLTLESYGPQSVVIVLNDFATLGVLLELLQLVSENVLKVERHHGLFSQLVPLFESPLQIVLGCKVWFYAWLKVLCASLIM